MNNETSHTVRFRKPPTEESFTKAASDMMTVAKYWEWSYLYVVPGGEDCRDILWVKDVDNQLGSGCPDPGHTKPPEGSILLTKLHAIGPDREMPRMKDVEEFVFFAYEAFRETVEKTVSGGIPPTPTPPLTMRSSMYTEQPTLGSMKKVAVDMRKIAKYSGCAVLYVVPLGNRGRRDALWVMDVDNQLGSGCPVPGHAKSPEGSILLTQLHAAGPKRKLPRADDVESIVFFAHDAFRKTWKSTMDGGILPASHAPSTRFTEEPAHMRHGAGPERSTPLKNGQHRTTEQTAEQQYNPYDIPTKAAGLLKDTDRRVAELRRVLRTVDVGLHGMRRADTERMIADAGEDVDISMFGQALRYLTLCTGSEECREFSYSQKHRAEEITIDGKRCYVANGIIIAAVLMCGGSIADDHGGPNAYLGIRQPNRCGQRGSLTGCMRLIVPGKKRLCSVCRAMEYRDRPRVDHGHIRIFNNMHAKSLTTFPPSTDILSDQPNKKTNW